MTYAFTNFNAVVVEDREWRSLSNFVGNLTIIGSGNDLSPSRREAIIWTIAWILFVNCTLRNKLTNYIQ